MMARSRCSNQRPDTVMQDRINQVDEISCTARPDHTVGSIASVGPSSMTSDLALEADTATVGRHVSKVPFPDSCIGAKHTLFDHFVRAAEHRCRQIEEE